MEKLITGIHHITALASNPQRNVDFYTGVLGLRLVKKTINFDSPDVYHFYFGDELGTPGTILTFFPFEGAKRGQKGVGEATYTAFSISNNSISFWQERLKRLDITVSKPVSRFGDIVLRFEDHDGMGIELVANASDGRKGWTYGNIPLEHRIRGFHSTTLNLRSKELTVSLLTVAMDYVLIGEENNRFRYGTKGEPGDIVDIVINQPANRSIQSAGTVHHIAFRTANEASQLKVQQVLWDFGQQVTEVKDRSYFKSIYFREPGGILFEVATDEPGFAIDEEIDHLGENLKLPDWAEAKREVIAENLASITLQPTKYD